MQPAAQRFSIEYADTALPGLTPAAPAAPPIDERFPEDLRTPWSWPDIILFFVFALGSTVVLPLLAFGVAYFGWGVTITSMEKSPTIKAEVATAGMTLIWLATIGYLYLTIRFRRKAPFWRTIGWRPMKLQTVSSASARLVCLLGGVATALVVQLASAAMRTKAELPIEEFFRSRTSVLLLMSFGILVAPLVEETVFRGYIYPVLARGFGVPTGVVVTGMLFGLLHAQQLWGGWGQIGLIVLVGILFTYVRARTGTVLASYFFHLGYNGFLFLGFFVATGGLRHIPGST